MLTLIMLALLNLNVFKHCCFFLLQKLKQINKTYRTTDGLLRPHECGQLWREVRVPTALPHTPHTPPTPPTRATRRGCPGRSG